MDVAGARHRDRDKDHLADPLGMTLSVGQAQCHAPGRATDEPPVDLEVLAEALHITDQMVSRIGR
jgi:hypothetical protein